MGPAPFRDFRFGLESDFGFRASGFPRGDHAMTVRRLKAGELYHRCDPKSFTFETTEALEPLREGVGQARAVEAVRFGIDIAREGYHIFALGPPGTGKRSLVQQFLEDRAPGEPTPDDWC